MTSVHLDHIFKRFGSTVALNDIDLKINAGELFFLLGPSGCGKSTLLRLIAGLHDPNGGRILFNDRDVTGLPTEQRNAVMCFQSYALWPHMSVRENVRFGLEVRGVESRSGKIAWMRFCLSYRWISSPIGNRTSFPAGSSSAWRWRGLAVNPACLLLDEPLSNLDAQLRLEMRSEIRRICKTAGFTTIYVTHDQKEALSVADRIAVLKDGKLIQVGTPGELYHHPNSAFVASFLGQTNLLSGRVIERHATTVRVETAVGKFVAAGGIGLPDKVTISIRPEQMQIVRGDVIHHGRNRLTGQPTEMTFLGEARSICCG